MPRMILRPVRDVDGKKLAKGHTHGVLGLKGDIELGIGFVVDADAWLKLQLGAIDFHQMRMCSSDDA